MGGAESRHAAPGAQDWLDGRLAEIMRKQGAEQRSTISFSKLLLKFGTLQKGFLRCHSIFKAMDSDGNQIIDIQELRDGMRSAHLDVDDTLLVRVFNSADIDNSCSIDVREFIVVLAIISLLLEDAGKATDFHPEILETFRLARQSFLAFDDSGDGVIQLGEVIAAMSEKNARGRRISGAGEGGAATDTLRRRFQEMDCDSSGAVSFKEFLFALEGWVMSTEADEDADEDV